MPLIVTYNIKMNVIFTRELYFQKPQWLYARKCNGSVRNPAFRLLVWIRYLVPFILLTYKYKDSIKCEIHSVCYFDTEHLNLKPFQPS